MHFHLLHAHRNDCHEIINEIVTCAPDFYARGKAAEISDLKFSAGTSGDAATGSNMSSSPNAHLRGKIAIVVDNRVVADYKILGMADSTVG